MDQSPLELILTLGDPQGIGPEVGQRAADALVASDPTFRIVIVGHGAFRQGAPDPDVPGAGIRFLEIEGALPSGPGPSAAGGDMAFRTLVAGCARARESLETRALVTAPVSKEAITCAGTPFTGHTGWLAEQFGKKDALMLFAGGPFRVALATVHLPLKDVPAALTLEGVVETLEEFQSGLRSLYGIPSPTLAVLGLNPHAGEGGLLGREEQTVIGPAIAAFNRAGGTASGPFSADTYFITDGARHVDGILAMYHDQGLIPVKCLSFGASVNVTVGLPLVRTSVDHGCAFDIAGTGKANARSMETALRHARDLLLRRAR